jgi:hypothetical protein
VPQPTTLGCLQLNLISLFPIKKVPYFIVSQVPAQRNEALHLRDKGYDKVLPFQGYRAHQGEWSNGGKMISRGKPKKI